MAALRALLIVACISAACATESAWDGLRVRWSAVGLVDIFHLSAFFDLPKTVDDAKKGGWVEAADTEASAFPIYCLKDDPRVCVLYDANGVAAGVDVSVLEEDVSSLDVDYDMDAQDMFVKMTRNGYSIYRTRVYWVSEDEVKEGRSTWKNGLGSGLWFEGKSGRLQIPVEQSKIESDTPYTKQACIPTMGTHYYYNMTETTDCSKSFPYFLLVDEGSGKLHGVGFQTYGKATKKSSNWRNWFEDIPIFAIKPTVPHSPQCLVDWVDKVGVISMHVYFKDNALKIWC